MLIIIVAAITFYFVRKILKATIKVAAISSIMLAILSGGIKWENHVIRVDDSNKHIHSIKSTIDKTIGTTTSIIDSMEAGSKDTLASKERMNQIKNIVMSLNKAKAYIDSKGTIYDYIPYISDMKKVSEKEEASMFNKIDDMESSYYSNVSNVYDSNISNMEKNGIKEQERRFGKRNTTIRHAKREHKEYW